MNAKKMEDGIRLFLEGVAERFEGDDLDRTPERVARAWEDDLLAGYGVDAEGELTWTAVSPGSELVVVRDLTFASVCVHHLLPFTGTVHVAYLPDRRLAGLSKLGRVVDALSRRLQIQERLTAQVAGCLDAALRPRGVLVRMEAVHTCMTLRGVRKEGSRLITLATRGLYADDPDARREVLSVLAPAPAR